jgi:hypothetical protein
MPKVNPDTLIMLPGGQWIPAAFTGAGVGADGKVAVNDDTVVKLPGGGTLAAAFIPQDPTYTTQPLTTNPAADTSARTAAASAEQALRDQGLEELIPDLDKALRSGGTFDEWKLRFFDKTTNEGQVVDRLYPEWGARRAAGNPISIQQIVAYRATAKQVMRAAGVPEGFYDSLDDFRKLIEADVSPQELQARIQDGVVRVTQGSQEARDQLQKFYGIGTGELAAYALDPTRALPVIQRQVAAAETSGAAVRAGFGGLSTSEAEGLVSQGVTQDAAGQGFQALASSKELFTPLDQGEDTISRQEQLGAVFSNSAAARKRLEDRAARRKASFQGGGSLATSRTGLAGLSTQQ